MCVLVCASVGVDEAGRGGNPNSDSVAMCVCAHAHQVATPATVSACLLPENDSAVPRLPKDADRIWCCPILLAAAWTWAGHNVSKIL